MFHPRIGSERWSSVIEQPAAPDAVLRAFGADSRSPSPPTFPPASDLPSGALADAIAKVEEIWSRPQPAQGAGRALFAQRRQVHREDEQRRMQAAAEGKRLPKARLAEADARLVDLANQVQAVRDAYDRAPRQAAGVAPEAWQQATDAAATEVDAIGRA
jgi:hypothetical protein